MICTFQQRSEAELHITCDTTQALKKTRQKTNMLKKSKETKAMGPVKLERGCLIFLKFVLLMLDEMKKFRTLTLPENLVDSLLE